MVQYPKQDSTYSVPVLVVIDTYFKFPEVEMYTKNW